MAGGPSPETPARLRAERLRLGLERLAAALGARDVDGLLSCEAALAEELAPLDSVALSASDRSAIAADVQAARQALTRCRALGAANHLLADVTLDALGRVGAYGRDGATPTPSPRGRDLVMRA